MTLQHLKQAINDCRKGNVPFNNGEDLHCFLYENTWFPLRAVINYASNLAYAGVDYTKDRALYKLTELLPYIRIEKISVRNNQLFHLKINERLQEILRLSELIKVLSL